MSEEKKELVITDDLKPVLEMLTPADAGAIVELREELGDNWRKKQIFRTETEMRISVLNDAKHPTNASKYWQSVREQGAMFDALMGLTFDLRRSKLSRRKLEQEQKEAIAKGDEFTAEDTSWKNYVITDPDKYVSREEFKENKMKEEKNEYNNNIGNFFLESLISNVTLDENENQNTITINNGRKSFNYQLVNFGDQGIMEDISKEPILDRTTEDIFLERCLGKHYTVNNFSDQRFTITKENSDKVLLLKKI